jgi:hypothetical protein
MLSKKHVLAAAAASIMALGATSLSAAPLMSHSAGARTANSHGMTQVHYKRHRTHLRMQQLSRNWSPFDAPAAAVAGAGAIAGGALATTGAIVGGTTAAVSGYPYGPYTYGGYGYAPNGYGAYAYAPGAYAPGGYATGAYARDIGNGYYNGNAAPAAQDSCAGDGGYGRLDYAIGC